MLNHLHSSESSRDGKVWFVQCSVAKGQGRVCAGTIGLCPQLFCEKLSKATLKWTRNCEALGFFPAQWISESEGFPPKDRLIKHLPAVLLSSSNTPSSEASITPLC